MFPKLLVSYLKCSNNPASLVPATLEQLEDILKGQKEAEEEFLFEE